MGSPRNVASLLYALSYTRSHRHIFTPGVGKIRLEKLPGTKPWFALRSTISQAACRIPKCQLQSPFRLLPLKVADGPQRTNNKQVMQANRKTTPGLQVPSRKSATYQSQSGLAVCHWQRKQAGNKQSE